MSRSTLPAIPKAPTSKELKAMPLEELIARMNALEEMITVKTSLTRYRNIGLAISVYEDEVLDRGYDEVKYIDGSYQAVGGAEERKRLIEQIKSFDFTTLETFSLNALASVLPHLK